MPRRPALREAQRELLSPSHARELLIIWTHSPCPHHALHVNVYCATWGILKSRQIRTQQLYDIHFEELNLFHLLKSYCTCLEGGEWHHAGGNKGEEQAVKELRNIALPFAKQE